MKFCNTLKLSAILMLLILFPVIGCAENSKQDQRGHQGPPPEAIEACKDKNEGDAVTFAGRQGETLKATCEKTPEGTLVARPEGHKPK